MWWIPSRFFISSVPTPAPAAFVPRRFIAPCDESKRWRDTRQMADVVRRLPGPARELLRLLLVALAYWVTARFSLDLALVRGQVTPVWPPAGIAVAAMLVIGLRVWPAIAVAAFAVNLPI